LPEPGGQCVALYPDKPIYDVPGIPVCTGRELAAQLLAQARPFVPADGSTLHLNQQVMSLAVDDAHPLGKHRFHLKSGAGTEFMARCVIVSAGAGAFVHKALAIPGLDTAQAPANLHHQLLNANIAAPWAGQHLVVAGGGDEALQTVLDLANANITQGPARLTLLHRRDQFQAEASLEAAVRGLISSGQVQLVLGVPQACELDTSGTQPVLRALTLSTADGAAPLMLDHLLVRLGMSPKLGPLSEWGLALERKQVSVNPSTFESSVPGIYAVGDINTYPGKKRLLLCGFHEATLAAHAASLALHPETPQHLLYTTTSPLLHQRLGLI
jgi:thioredoxin reductase (NADPH)